MKFDLHQDTLAFEISLSNLREKLNIFLSTHPIPQSVIQALHNLGL